MAFGCCGRCATLDVKRTLVKIENYIVGIAGLDHVFEKLYTSKKSPDNIDGIEIVNMASFFHHIPNSKVEAYAEALKKEYRQFCRDKKDVTA
jgi:hypothetical protein